jgi:hypothetical protein
VHFDDPAIRAAYRRGARAAYDSALPFVEARQERAVQAWLKELEAWEGGDPLAPSCGLALATFFSLNLFRFFVQLDGHLCECLPRVIVSGESGTIPCIAWLASESAPSPHSWARRLAKARWPTIYSSAGGFCFATFRERLFPTPSA